jgi:molecular chaperone DnaK
VNIHILQGDAKDLDDCVQLGTVRLENLPPYPKGSPVEITFSYDADGILHVTGVFGLTGQSVKTKIEVQGTMSPEAAQRSRRELQNINVE